MKAYFCITLVLVFLLCSSASSQNIFSNQKIEYYDVKNMEETPLTHAFNITYSYVHIFNSSIQGMVKDSTFWQI